MVIGRGVLVVGWILGWCILPKRNACLLVGFIYYLKVNFLFRSSFCYILAIAIFNNELQRNHDVNDPLPALFRIWLFELEFISELYISMPFLKWVLGKHRQLTRMRLSLYLHKNICYNNAWGTYWTLPAALEHVPRNNTSDEINTNVRHVWVVTDLFFLKSIIQH